MIDYNLGEKYADRFVSVSNEPMYNFDEFSYFGKDFLWPSQQDNEYENLFDRLGYLSQWARTIERAQAQDAKQESVDSPTESTKELTTELNPESSSEVSTEPDKTNPKPTYESSILQASTPKVTQIGGFNVDAAIKRLHYLTNFNIKDNDPKKWSRKSPTSKSRNCARAVRMAMEAGGLSTEGRPRYGGNYGPFLLSHGWYVLSNDTVPQAGDICVSHGLGREGWGHISMYDGSKWVSDYVQNSWKQFGKAKLGTNTHFYRYRG